MSGRCRVKDLKEGHCALIKNEWRRIRGVYRLATLEFKPSSDYQVVWHPGDRRSNAILPGDVFVNVREDGK